jgi:hypothetical protein
MLSQHIAARCADVGADCQSAVGVDAGLRLARHTPPHVVLCEVDLLIPGAMDEWERESRLADVPLLAVSLTRRHNESPVLAGSPIAGFLYLPALDVADLSRALSAATGSGTLVPSDAYRWDADAEPTPKA